MNSEVLETMAVSLVFAVIFGPLLARSSARRDRIYGGTLSHLFHIISAGGMVGALPGVIAGVILGVPFLTTVAVAFGCLGISLLASLLFAIVEKPSLPAPVVTEDRGWTAQDARTSGL
ncbi:MAG: hypothetical protein SF029_13580 [bacterium]|nr:hypothetical protein [bacterium]